MMNNIRGRLPLADAIAIAVMLARTGRAVPPGDWVEVRADGVDDILAEFGPI